MWDAIVDWLGKGRGNAPSREAALAALERITGKGLVPVHARVSLGSTFAAHIKHNKPSPAAAALILAYCGHGETLSQHCLFWQR